MASAEVYPDPGDPALLGALLASGARMAVAVIQARSRPAGGREPERGLETWGIPGTLAFRDARIFAPRAPEGPPEAPSP